MATQSIIDQGNALLRSGQAEAAVRLMSSAAARGDGDALYQLALWRVYGHPLPRDFAIARELFGRAGVAGNKLAARTYAVFVAIGARAEPDWRAALALLEAASATDPVAARQHTLLSAMAIDSGGFPIATPELEILSAAPKLGLVRGVFTPEECDHVTALSAPTLVPSVVVDPQTQRQIPHPIRTSDGTVLGPVQQDLVIEALNRRLAAVTGTRVEQGEPLAVLRYAPGQQYRLHHDCLPGEANQRIITAIVYLNDGYTGGATEFPSIHRAIQGRKGDAIVFSNTFSNGCVDENSRHAGQPVTHGQKWICTRWIRANDFDPWGMRLT